jgi:hypothetical protein
MNTNGGRDSRRRTAHLRGVGYEGGAVAAASSRRLNAAIVLGYDRESITGPGG